MKKVSFLISLFFAIIFSVECKADELSKSEIKMEIALDSVANPSGWYPLEMVLSEYIIQLDYNLDMDNYFAFLKYISENDKKLKALNPELNTMALEWFKDNGFIRDNNICFDPLIKELPSFSSKKKVRELKKYVSSVQESRFSISAGQVANDLTKLFKAEDFEKSLYQKYMMVLITPFLLEI